MRVRGAVVVITGASTGVGRATALELASHGAVLALAGRRAADLESLARQCRARGARTLIVETNELDEASVMALARRVVDTFGRIDVWVNIAAVTEYTRFLETRPELFKEIIETNLFGYVYGGRAALPQMEAQGRGILINVSTVFSRAAAPYASGFATSRYAIEAYSDSLRPRARLAGVHVCSVVPPAFGAPPLRLRRAGRSGAWAAQLAPVVTPRAVARAVVHCIRWPRHEVVVGRSRRRVLRLRAALHRRARAIEQVWHHREAVPELARPGAAALAHRRAVRRRWLLMTLMPIVGALAWTLRRRSSRTG